MFKRRFFRSIICLNAVFEKKKNYFSAGFLGVGRSYV